MIESLIETDHSVFLAINGIHSNLLDHIMIFFSHRWVWTPLYAFVIYLLYRKLGWKKTLIAVVAVILTFTLCDQISVFIKNWVQRPRPEHEPLLEGMVKLLESKGGQYGFVSSHAANVFGFAVTTAAILKNKTQPSISLIYTPLIYTWAALVSFSRIVVGKHYPLDIICGAILGILIGLLLLMIYRLITNKFSAKLT